MDADKATPRMSVEEAARRMGVTPMFLRMGLRLGKFPFGTAIQTSRSRWTYYINRKRFEVYMAGVDMANAYDQTTTKPAELLAYRAEIAERWIAEIPVTTALTETTEGAEDP
ncbi:MAG: hypothetical protein LOD85_01130 [Clostridia bacterium]